MKEHLVESADWPAEKKVREAIDEIVHSILERHPEATFEVEWLNLSNELALTMIGEFYQSGRFYDTGVTHEELVTRPRDAYDSATPSGNSVACDVLIRLAHLVGDTGFAQIATDVLSGFGQVASENPHGYARLLSAISVRNSGGPEM